MNAIHKKEEPVYQQAPRVPDAFKLIEIQDKVNEENVDTSISRFSLDKKGVWYIPPPSSDKSFDPIWICSLLTVLAITRDENNENYGRLLKWMDSDNKPHQWAMPMELLSGDGNEYRRNLLSMGLLIAPGRKARDLLTEYIQTQTPALTARCVAQTGWFNDAYVFPDQTIQENGERHEHIYFQAVVKKKHCFEKSGSLEEWQQHIAKYCVENSRLSFSVGVAFAAPLLKIFGEENCGFHFRGPSSNGKTTFSMTPRLKAGRLERGINAAVKAKAHFHPDVHPA